MDIVMPQLAETVMEGIITAWYKQAGDAVAADESLFEVETAKVSTAIPSPVPGVVREILVDTGVSVRVGTRLAVIAESGLKPEEVRGRGRDGRINEEEMLNRIASAAPQLPTESEDSPGRATVASQEDRVVPLNKIRRATAAHTVRSVATSPHTLQAVEVDFQNIDRARNARATEWKVQEGFALTFLPFVCAAICEALVDFPHINATFADDALIVHHRINLGIAVDVGFEGLLVPVIHDANHRSVRGLARKINTLVQKARTNALTPDDLQGGTYTVSNSGSFGTLITAPIINQPQVAILSLDGVHKKPTVIESPGGDAIAIRPIGILAQSFDHRAFDGAYSAAFLRRLKQALESRNWLAELN
jgi:pyruvate/2-oxoglutarate dehydrogenase complex dihydrolipoamide acyltransferase (E2) component